MRPNLADARWQIRHDPLSQGLASGWCKTPPADGWKDIPVPCAWQQVLGVDANGLAWYRTTLDDVLRTGLESQSRRVMLRFDAVATDCMVWLNGVYIGRNLGDYLPFEFDIAPAIRQAAAGEPLVLTVRVDQYNAPRPAKGVVVENGHITKGFHDVLSIQHAGIWDRVSFRSAGPAVIAPNGVQATVSPDGRSVSVRVEFSQPTGGVRCRARLLNDANESVRDGELRIEVDGKTASGMLSLARPLAAWNPDAPVCYRLHVAAGDDPVCDEATVTVAWRDIRARTMGGVGAIWLNNRPLHIRGVLYWGHEPKTMSPAPPREQVEAEFAYLRSLGFNCVCFCMYYPPDYVYDIADRTGMLVWQEHPVWKSRMTPEFMPEYHRLYQGFMRRDAQHPSVIIVSGTCEHEAYDPDLAAWWWKTARAMLPDKLLQIQTGFLEQTQPQFTDLYDDHVYDNCGRWACFLPDMQKRIAELGAKPFVMGETIISNIWPDVASMKQAMAQRPWWLSRGLAECEQFEQWLARRYTPEALNRFKRQARAFSIEFRKFQTELLRGTDGFAGFVTNSIRDVPICRIGLKDDLDHWRFTPQDTQSWLADSILLLRTADLARAVPAGTTLDATMALTQAPSSPHTCRVSVDGAHAGDLDLNTAALKISWHPLKIRLPDVPPDGAARLVTVRADVIGLADNEWNLVALPAPTWPQAMRVLSGHDLSPTELEPEFEERAYSSGWCLECRSWKPRHPTAEELFPHAAKITQAGGELDPRTVIITPRLTKFVHEHLTRGGRVLLLAHRNAGGLSTKWINLWGQLPLLVEDGAAHWPIRPGESDAVAAMLHFDLTRFSTRAIPVDDLGITEHVTPIIRYVYTHDNGAPKMFDAVTTARVHEGLLIATCLDHTTPAGQFMLSRLAHCAASWEPGPGERELDLAAFVV